MAYLRLTLTDADLAALKGAALASRLSTSAWARSVLIKRALVASPKSRPTKEDARTLARFEETLANVRDNPSLRGDVAAFVELRREEYRRGFASKAADDYIERFAEWAAANGHMKGEQNEQDS